MIIPSNVACQTCQAQKHDGDLWLAATVTQRDGEALIVMKWTRDVPVLMKYPIHFCSENCADQHTRKLIPERPRESAASYFPPSNEARKPEVTSRTSLIRMGETKVRSRGGLPPL